MFCQGYGTTSNYDGIGLYSITDIRGRSQTGEYFDANKAKGLSG